MKNEALGCLGLLYDRLRLATLLPGPLPNAGPDEAADRARSERLQKEQAAQQQAAGGAGDAGDRKQLVRSSSLQRARSLPLVERKLESTGPTQSFYGPIHALPLLARSLATITTRTAAARVRMPCPSICVFDVRGADLFLRRRLPACCARCRSRPARARRTNRPPSWTAWLLRSLPSSNRWEFVFTGWLTNFELTPRLSLQSDRALQRCSVAALATASERIAAALTSKSAAPSSVAAAAKALLEPLSHIRGMLRFACCVRQIPPIDRVC